MQNFWANFTDFEPEINLIICKTEKLKTKNLNILMQDYSTVACILEKQIMQKICERGP